MSKQKAIVLLHPLVLTGREIANISPERLAAAAAKNLAKELKKLRKRNKSKSDLRFVQSACEPF